ncbi:MAG TPA: adenylyltransferase, partial [Tahibacter sp.]|nr:adenylyltransferase [Tahibacter sp.]
MSQLIAPHGGRLVDRHVAADAREAHKHEAAQLPAWDLTPRQLCDLELIANGAFSPLEGFLGRADYEAVCRDMRLADGTLWPMPVTLDVSREFAEKLGDAARIALRDPEGVTLAILDVTDRWEPDREAEARAVFGTTDRLHAGVAYLLDRANPVYLGGRVHALAQPAHYDFRHLRLSPREVRAHFDKLGWRRIVAFQTRNPMHRAHLELTFRAAQIAEANLLIHPSVGMTKPGDIDHYTRVRCYEKLIAHYPEQTTLLSLLHLAMRM